MTFAFENHLPLSLYIYNALCYALKVHMSSRGATRETPTLRFQLYRGYPDLELYRYSRFQLLDA